MQTSETSNYLNAAISSNVAYSSETVSHFICRRKVRGLVFKFALSLLLIPGCAGSDSGVSQGMNGVSESAGPWKLIKRETESEILTFNREGDFLVVKTSVGNQQRSFSGKMPETIREQVVRLADEVAASDFSANASCAGYSEISGHPSLVRNLTLKSVSGSIEKFLDDDKTKKIICLKGNAKAALRLDSVLRSLTEKY